MQTSKGLQINLPSNRQQQFVHEESGSPPFVLLIVNEAPTCKFIKCKQATSSFTVSKESKSQHGEP